jgi:hypothetical protein
MDSTTALRIEQPITGDRRRWKTYVLRALIWLCIGAAMWVCAVEGLRVRRWIYDAADPIRFVDDMRRGTFWGLHASGPEGYFNQYDKMDAQVPEWQDSRWAPWLDYSPLRLLVMREWGAWQWKHHPPKPGISLMDAWQRPYWFTAPVLRFNTVLEGFSALFAFLLTQHWVVRGTLAEKRGHFTGVWQGVAAALFIWFSPDMIVNAHAWPQWDTWVVPWYLCGCLLASLDWWFAAGVAIAIGVNFKGQMLPITPIFVIWPLVQGRVGAAVRWICGAGFCYSVIVSGWLLSYLPPDRLAVARSFEANHAVTDFPLNLFAIPRIFDVPAATWIAVMLIVVGVVPRLLRALVPKQLEGSESRLQAILRSRWTWIAMAAMFIIASVYWPWLLRQNRGSWYVGLMLACAVAAAGLLLRARLEPYLLAAVAGTGLFACIWLFHGDTAWWDCAVHYGSIHWPYLFTGPTSNVPAVFQLRFNWRREIDQIAFTLPALHVHWPAFMARRNWWPASDVDVSAKWLFNTIFGVMLLISGIAIGIQTRRNDRRALVAFVTPWIMFFLWPVQIQERYLLYGAAAAACCIGESIGAALLGLLLTLFSLMMPMKILLDWSYWWDLRALGNNLARAVPWLFSPDSGRTMRRYLDGTQPDIAWGILVLSLVFLYLSLTPSRSQTIAAKQHRVDVPDAAVIEAPLCRVRG